MSQFQAYETATELTLRSTLEEEKTLKLGYRIFNRFNEPSSSVFPLIVTTPFHQIPLLTPIVHFEREQSENYLEIEILEDRVFNLYFGENSYQFRRADFEYRGLFHEESIDTFVFCFSFEVTECVKDSFLDLMMKKYGEEGITTGVENAVKCLSRMILDDPEVLDMKNKIAGEGKNV